MYPVNEIFQSVQGEAAFTGTPSIFVRLQGCPVGCGWCDTKHTWEVDPAKEVSAAEMMAKPSDAPSFGRMTAAQIAGVLVAMPARHAVITGGEPCLYDLNPLCDALLAAGKSVQIETSGTHEIHAPAWAWVTVSPKIGMPGGLLMRMDATQRANEIKFPVGKLSDVEKFKDAILPVLHEGQRVWLQPLSQSPKATKLCIDATTEHGWRISIQTHKFLGVR